MKNEKNDLFMDKDRIVNEMQTKAACSKDFSSLKHACANAPDDRIKAQRKRNKIIAWSTVAASFLLIISLTLPAFIDIISSEPGIFFPTTDTDDGIQAPGTDTSTAAEKDHEEQKTVICAHTEEGIKNVTYTEYEGTRSEPYISYPDKRAVNDHKAFAVEMELFFDEQITCIADVQVTVDLWFLNFSRLGPHETTVSKNEKIQLENGKGTYCLSLVGSNFPAESERRYTVSITYGEKTQSFEWWETHYLNTSVLDENDIPDKDTKELSVDITASLETGKKYNVQSESFSSVDSHTQTLLDVWKSENGKNLGLTSANEFDFEISSFDKDGNCLVLTDDQLEPTEVNCIPLYTYFPHLSKDMDLKILYPEGSTGKVTATLEIYKSVPDSEEIKIGIYTWTNDEKTQEKSTVFRDLPPLKANEQQTYVLTVSSGEITKTHKWYERNYII